MPKITVEHATELSPTDAFTKLKTFFETDSDMRRLDPKLKCSFKEDNMTGQATGSQFKADLSVKEKSGASNAGSLVVIVVDLPFILTPLKGKIQETVQRKLAKHLG